MSRPCTDWPITRVSVTNEGDTVVVVLDVVVAAAVVVVTAVVVVVGVGADDEVDGSVVDVETTSDVSGDEVVRPSDEQAMTSCDATSNTGHHDRGVTAAEANAVVHSPSPRLGAAASTRSAPGRA
jgi:hypothetical protein